jgi:hypothetical protein
LICWSSFADLSAILRANWPRDRDRSGDRDAGPSVPKGGGIGQLIRLTITITIRERNRKANIVNQLPRTGENIMVKVYFRYIRYTLSMLATVGFGINAGN